MTSDAFQCDYCRHPDVDAFPAVVCKHLFAEPRQFWHAPPPSFDEDENNYWPDAHCLQCEKEFAEGGRAATLPRSIEAVSNENETPALLPRTRENDRLICSDCYEEYMASSMEAAELPVCEEWDKFTWDCRQNLFDRQTSLVAKFPLEECVRFDFDPETGNLILFWADGSCAIADTAIVGTFSFELERWYWAWSNPHFNEPIRSRMIRIQRFGNLARYPRLTIPTWRAKAGIGMLMTTVASIILDAKGYVTLPANPNSEIYLAVMDIRRLPASH